jgi:hypothetical protein
VVLLISTYLLLVFVVPVLVSAMIGFRALPRTASCPHCQLDTAQLQPRGGGPGRALLRWLRLQRRWCVGCGWIGITRRTAATASVPVVEAAAAEAPAIQVLDVRSLRLDGRTWRVQLQCWQDAVQCHGRLAFVDPGGRPWPDALQAFTARTQMEVLGQALSIPDRALASRLRQLITAD